eukprot:8079308-Alexandrium_andersonii.AAC.1
MLAASLRRRRSYCTATAHVPDTQRALRDGNAPGDRRGKVLVGKLGAAMRGELPTSQEGHN